MPRRIAATEPCPLWQRMHLPRPEHGSPQSGQLGAGTGSDTNLALPPHERPHVLTWLVNGTNGLPHTTHLRSASGSRSGICNWYSDARPPANFVRSVTRYPSPSSRIAISGSAEVNRAEAECPSPSQTPSAYG